jgi:hypothetical protein
VYPTWVEAVSMSSLKPVLPKSTPERPRKARAPIRPLWVSNEPFCSGCRPTEKLVQLTWDWCSKKNQRAGSTWITST